ncbi:phage repressor protein CI [Sodalis sp. RH19]|uniref:phage repressor protein CI n=1 Tax=Sodalis sp. RH19 TaxID=3394334 RepID=UPI0039B456CE
MSFEGGQKVVDRLLKAYGFSTQRELVEKIGVGHGTVSTWIRRDYFPGEAVVQCALDTGISLEWLATGKGDPGVGSKTGVNAKDAALINMPCKTLHSGRLTEIDSVLVAGEIMPGPVLEPEMIIAQGDKHSFIIERSFSASTDGDWLIEKAGVISVESIKRMPGDNWRIETVDWPAKEVQLLGKVVCIIISKV